MTTARMGHFVPADRTETCKECDATIKPDELMMPVWIREPGYSGFHRTRVVYCYGCGCLYLESQWATGSVEP